MQRAMTRVRGASSSNGRLAAFTMWPWSLLILSVIPIAVPIGSESCLTESLYALADHGSHV